MLTIDVGKSSGRVVTCRKTAIHPPAMLTCMTDITLRKWGVTVLTAVRVAATKSNVVEDPRVVEGDLTDGVVVPDAGGATQGICNKATESASETWLETSRMRKCMRIVMQDE